jgi:hypothetical protein
MHSCRRSATAPLVLLLLLLPTAPRSAHADEFQDFRIPENRSMRWDLAFGGGAFRQDQGVPTTDFEQRGLDGRLSTQASWLWDSDPAYTSVSAFAGASGDMRRSTIRNLLSAPTLVLVSDTDNDNEFIQERIQVGVDHRRYLGAGPVALTASAAAAGNYMQSWGSTDRHEDVANAGNSIITDEQSRSERWGYAQMVFARLGGGLGRVRDATGVYEARVLEARLREAGVLTRDLSPAARQRLAGLAYLRWSAAGVHDRPARSVWAEIEEILEEDGAVVEAGLDAAAILRALEPHMAGSLIDDTGIPASPVPRARGHFAGLFAEYQHVHELSRLDDELSRTQVVNGVPQPPVYASQGTRSTNEEDRLFGGLEAESHMPLALDLQLDLTGRVLMPVREVDTELFAGGSAIFAWMVADRWLARAQAAADWLDADRRTGESPGDRSIWTLSAQLDYYLENRMTLFAGFFDGERTYRGGEPGFSPPDSYQRDRGVSVGVTYRLAGRYAAPGFDHLGL